MNFDRSCAYELLGVMGEFIGPKHIYQDCGRLVCSVNFQRWISSLLNCTDIHLMDYLWLRKAGCMLRNT